MKNVLLILVLFCLLPFNFLLSQAAFYTESFETFDTLTLPQGWSKWNRRWYPINPFANWTVRDTGIKVPNIGGLSVAKDGKKSIMVSWGASLDTTSKRHLDTADLSDAWLVTKQFRNIPNDAILSFWACGGRQNPSPLGDSLQIWVSTSDSLPGSFTHYIETEFWVTNIIYGNFTNYIIDLSTFAGQNIRIGFRYYMDCAIDGYCVYLDKFQMLGTIGITPIGSNIPKDFALHQNYPNPFNPTTRIKFDLPRNTDVTLEVYNSLGQIVQTLYKGYANAGYYETDFNASNLPSGAYFCRILTKDFTKVMRMMLVK